MLCDGDCVCLSDDEDLSQRRNMLIDALAQPVDSASLKLWEELAPMSFQTLKSSFSYPESISV